MTKLFQKCFHKSLQTFCLLFVILYIFDNKCINCWSVHESVASAYTVTHADQIELKFSIQEGVPIGTLIGVIKSTNSSINTQPPYLIVPIPGGVHKPNSSQTSSPHSSNGAKGVDTDLDIDQSTGEIRTAVQLDREQRSYYLFIAIPLTGANIKVLITIEDINDNSPQFPTNEIHLEFPENSKSKRTLPPARDLDLGQFGTQEYRIVSGNVGNAFRLSSHREKDDVLYLDLQVNGALDREVISSYKLVIEALDGGHPRLRGEMTVNIAILDHNDCEPVFSQSHYYSNVAENVTVGTSLLRVTATDNDQGDNGLITYSIHSKSSGLSGFPTYFEINRNNGWIFVVKPLDFESKKIHEFAVIARDSGAQPLETSAFVSIRVTDVNDNQPTINLLFLTENTRSEISENAKIGDLIARVSVNDADSHDIPTISHPNGETLSGLSVSLIGNDGAFGLTTQDSVIYLIKVTGPLDRETKSNYTLTIVVTEGGSSPLNTTKSFELEVLDINDNPPYFDSDTYHVTLPEAADIGSSVFRAQALDSDSDSQIAYSFLEHNFDNSSTSKWFSIDSKSGLITTQTQVDCETDPMPKLIILAKDISPSMMGTTYSATTTLIVTISDINDNEPIFDQSFYNITVREDEPIGSCILKISASDPDCGVNAMVNYTTMNSILSDMASNVNTYQQDFTIHPITGELCIARQLDYETRNSYDIPVLATDRGGLSTTAMIKVQVMDTNDNNPVFYPREYKVSVTENEVPNGRTPLVSVAATDRDSTGFGSITYAIKDGNEDQEFEIEEKTGNIYIAKPLSSDKPLHQLTIIAKDGGNIVSKIPALVHVSVLSNTGPNSNPPVFSQRQYNFEVRENVKSGTNVGTVSAVIDTKDFLNRMNKDIAYVIYSGDPDGYFSIDRSLGVITVRSNHIDHEKYNFLLLNVQAFSGRPPGPYQYGHTQVNVTIVDTNDNSPIFAINKLKISVPENTFTNNVTVLVAHAVDIDSGIFGRIDYSISNNEYNLMSTPLPFSINRYTGAVTLNSSLDFEHISQYKFKITARDGANLSSDLYVEVLVQDSNDNEPVFMGTTSNQRLQYRVNVSEDISINSHFFQVKATDADTGNNARLTYSLVSDWHIFGIFPNNGMLYIKELLDRETKDRYEIEIKVTDHGSPFPLSSVALMEITVIDVNDNKPHWVENSYVFSIVENSDIGALIGKIAATDPDLGNNSSLRYNISDGQTSELNAFQLNPITGEIYLKTKIDRKLKDKYEFTVEVWDEGSPQHLYSEDKAIVLVNISNMSDNRPTFELVLLSLIVLLMVIIVVLLVSIVSIRLHQHQQHLISGHVRHMGPNSLCSRLQKIGPVDTTDPNLSTYHPHHSSHYGSAPPAPPCYNDVTLASSAPIPNPEGHSASSGRGSAEDEADTDDVDEEIRMINENGNYYDEEDSDVMTTAEYLARLGVIDHHEEERGESTALEDEDDEDVVVDQLGNIRGPPIHMREHLNRIVSAGQSSDWTQMSGSLNSIAHSEKELSGSYNWDYLQHWGPKYQPLASVFAEIARLKASNREQNEPQVVVENGSIRSASTASSQRHQSSVYSTNSTRVTHPSPSMAPNNGFQSMSTINSSANESHFYEKIDLNSALSDEEIRI